jgi:protein TonB
MPRKTVELWDDVFGGGEAHRAAIDAVGGIFGSAALAATPGAEGKGTGEDTGEGDSLAGGGAGAPLGLAAPTGQSLPRPSYPEQARRRGEEGEVRLRLLVGVNGEVEQVGIAASSGYPALDEAAQEGARLWRFSPARRGEDAIRAWVEMPVRFRLDDPA